MITTATAWRELAKKCNKSGAGLRSTGGKFGLCYGLSQMQATAIITYEQWSDMFGLIYRKGVKVKGARQHYPFHWARNKRGYKQRYRFCLRQAKLEDAKIRVREGKCR